MIVSQDNLKLLLGVSSSITAEEESFLSLIHPQVEGLIKCYLQYDPEQKVHSAEYLPRHYRAGGPGYDDTGVYGVTGDRAYWYSGSGERTLQLTHLPVREVTSVYVDTDARHGDRDGAFAESTLWTVGTDYYVDWDQEDVCRSGHMYAYTSWPTEPGTVKATYRAGYSPSELAGNVTASSVSGGVITTLDVDGSGIAMAVQSTVIAAFLRAMSLKKKERAGFTPGALLTEKLGDYSYGVDKTTYAAGGFAVALPTEAKQMLEPYKHYGLARL